MKENCFKPFVDEYTKSLKVRNFGKRTINGIYWMLDKFVVWLIKSGITHVDGINKEIIRLYQIELYEIINIRGRQNCVSYQNNMLSSVKQFMRFLHERDYIVSNPAKEIQYARQPKTLPRGVLTASEARRIIHAPEHKDNYRIP